ncbi:O-acetyl-ADP-ribose deacetylase [uncultured Desulfuromusa sp.]|uniref:O-acetyl-ADP-ribose deacetylase n=1 Tax=uncultured Desulfuromusa sp. TaxID=219183 RepID=UPI002AA816EB|nr:O-acetyl-ADP-ribose deacetylase [uncultured Desulfuromusa sp.]
MGHISIIEGDLTQAHVDAIVNAANPKMLGGGGVDGAIHRAAGPSLREECLKVKSVNGIRCPVGEARITPAGNLAAKYVIHTVGPIYSEEPDPERLLESAYVNSLRLAIENRCKSVAFPAISCGIFGYPHQEAAKVALNVCYRKEFEVLDIYFYLFDQSAVEFWKAVHLGMRP